MKTLLKRSVVAASLAALASGASAALVTVHGTDFRITYDDTKLGLYSAPTLIGNIISFSPTDYKAESLNGNPSTLVDLEAQSINLTITLHDLTRINSITMSEGGNYVKHGSLSGVGVSGKTQAWDLAQPSGTLIDTPIALTAPLSITNAGVPNPDFTAHPWSGGTFTDLSGATYSATKVMSYSIQNLLYAFTAPFGTDPDLLRTAFVEKTFISLAVDVSPIPEPEVWAMMLVGAGLVGFQLRRKSKQSHGQRFV